MPGGRGGRLSGCPWHSPSRTAPRRWWCWTTPPFTGRVPCSRRDWGGNSRGSRSTILPAYCPHLNRIDGVWKRLKGFLLPRRCYDSVADLTAAVLTALQLLGAVEVQG